MPALDQLLQDQVNPKPRFRLGWEVIVVAAIIMMILVIVSALIYGLFQNKDTGPSIIEINKHSTNSATLSANPTKGWPSYINKKERVTFKYPPDWIENDRCEISIITPSLKSYFDNPFNCNAILNLDLRADMAKIKFIDKFSYKKLGFDRLSQYLEKEAARKDTDKRKIFNLSRNLYGDYKEIFIAQGLNIGKTNLTKVRIGYVDLGLGNAAEIRMYYPTDPSENFEEIFYLVLTTLDIY